MQSSLLPSSRHTIIEPAKPRWAKSGTKSFSRLLQAEYFLVDSSEEVRRRDGASQHMHSAAPAYTVIS